jgi:tetratricopeptide (TPR) repeat protein
MLDWALFEDGREELMGYSGQALEIYERIGDLEEEGNVLNNLAMFAFFRWRWDEALELLERAAASRQRAGIHGGVAASEVNIGDILLDRGLYQEASSHLERARRLWRSIGERAGSAYATALLGRLAVRDGRDREGLVLLGEAVAELRTLGSEREADFAESLLAEAEAFAGDPQKALILASELIPVADRTLPLLHRVSATALWRLERAGTTEQLETSLMLARDRGALYDVAAALDLFERISEPDPERANERDAILLQLGVVQLPTPRLNAGTTPVAA